MIKFHSVILIICSIVGFTGHYLQFGEARLTPWIPASAGILILALQITFNRRNDWWWLNCLSIILVIAFGVLTTNMCIRFLPEEFQPLRKKIIFSCMSVSAWITVVFFIRDRINNISRSAGRSA
jgi:hypothetical protein